MISATRRQVAQGVSSRGANGQALALRLAYAFAEIRDGPARKPPQLRRRCLRLAMLRLSGLELRQPEAQLGAVLRRKLHDGLLDVFQDHIWRIASGPRGLNEEAYSWSPQWARDREECQLVKDIPDAEPGTIPRHQGVPRGRLVGLNIS